MNKRDVTISFASKIDASYKNDLERIFFFNWHQSKYAPRITQSVKDYAKPIIFDNDDGSISLEFEERAMGQTLHIFDSEQDGASLIGVLMYVRENNKQITIVHVALHEGCTKLFNDSGINVLSLVTKKIKEMFSRIKGIEKIYFYYNNKSISL